MGPILLIVALLFNHGISTFDGDKGLCGTKYIRNSPKAMEKLRNCTVILGYLQMALIERATEQDWVNLTFPNLREVTQSVLIHRVHGLTTLRNLFPNLAVIRGYQTAFDYGLIIYDNANLHEVGLPALTTVKRGLVRIQNNDNLCYASSINWARITSSHEDFIDIDNQVRCPSSVKFCKHCKDYNCWSPMDCQIFEGDENCHRLCLGGCTEPGNAHSCNACQTFNDYGVCVDKCPDARFVIDNYYCLTKEDCLGQVLDHFPFENRCITKCPNNYKTVSAEEGYCKKCSDNEVCTEACNQSHYMTDMTTIKDAGNCRIINGSLELRFIKTQKTINELYSHLRHVHTITGSLKISRCNFVSLDFFESLQQIGGAHPFSNNSLMILENPNLESLFPNDVVVNKGKVFFHRNPRLCLSEINSLILQEKIPHSTVDISKTTNGDQVICGFVEIASKIKEVTATSARIEWEAFEPPEAYEVVAYEVHYIPRIQMNSVGNNYHIPEVCQNTLWNREVLRSPKELFFDITDLVPFTDYVYYVSAVVEQVSETEDVKDYIGRTKILDFQTLPDQPGRPENVQARAWSDSAVEIFWSEPIEKFGNLTSYILTATIYPNQVDSIESRNYCDYPIDEGKRRTELQELQRDVYLDRSLSDAICSLSNKCAPGGFRFRREITKVSDFGETNRFLATGERHTFITKLNASVNQFLLDNLRSFFKYKIEVAACNSGLEGVEYCSSTEWVEGRTMPKQDADDVEVFVTWNWFGLVYDLFWYEPMKPNLAVVAYQVEAAIITIEPDGFRAREILESKCVTRKQHALNEYRYFLDYLKTGIYEVRVRAISIGQNGRWSAPVTIEYSSMYTRNSLFLSLFGCFLLTGVCFSIHQIYRYILEIHPPSFKSKILNELPRQKIKFTKQCIQSLEEAGSLWWGTFNDRPVFILESTSDEDKEIHFFESIENFVQPNSKFIVNIVGFVSISTPYLIVYEAAEFGFLVWYLKRYSQINKFIPNRYLFEWAAEIADAMEYLHSKNIIHTDVATRNMLMRHDFTLRLTDSKVGIIVSPEQFNLHGSKLMPLRWTAPEILSNPESPFTRESDIWSYGVFLWELGNCNRIFHPYFPVENSDLTKSRLYLTPPLSFPTILGKIMLKCFKDPQQRPTFRRINSLNLSTFESFRLDSYLFRRNRNMDIPLQIDPAGVEIPMQDFGRVGEDLELLGYEEDIAQSEPVITSNSVISREHFEITEHDFIEWHDSLKDIQQLIAFRNNDDVPDWLT